MTTIKSDRVQTVTFHGGGDDLDQPIKTLRGDKELAKTHPTCGINREGILPSENYNLLGLFYIR